MQLNSSIRNQQTDRINLIAEKIRRDAELYRNYKPYAKQQEFHAAGVEYSERCLLAGNQTGKTFAGSMEAFFHLSGLYPEWWVGVRFTKPTVGWIGGDTGETIRDTTQRLLLDRPGKLDRPEEYAGIVPIRLLDGSPKPAMGVPNLYDHFKVKHVTGGISYCYFKSYAKGRQKFQGETIDWFWPDEEPPSDVYTEGLTRTNKGQHGQFAMLTFTPLLGMSEVVYSFLQKPSKHQLTVSMTISDVDHYTDAEKKQIIASYPEHEREARAKGIPIMGSGRVFPVSESSITEKPLELATIPGWWKQIAGIDFGWDHPTAAVRILYDPEDDIIHVHAEHRQSGVIPVVFAAGIKSWGNIPVAWPHDGLQHDKGSGLQLAEQYRTSGLNMLVEKATFEEGGNGVEAGIMDMLDRMETGRLKVSELLIEWFEEFRLYHRKNGLIVKERDDLMAATRYAVMMLRFAENIIIKKKIPYTSISNIAADKVMGY